MTKVYMKVSKDKYQLPEVIADSVKELAEKCGESPRIVSALLLKNEPGSTRTVRLSG